MSDKGHESKKFGLLGYPLKHSLSPYIHDDIMGNCGIKGSYKLYEISPHEFDNKACELISRLDGCNVTIPYKEKVIACLKQLKAEAELFRTVNTVSEDCGYSTDVEGLLDSGIPFEGSSVLILGAGGAARAVLLAAERSGCTNVGIWARRLEQADRLKQEFCGFCATTEVFIEPSAEVLPEKTVLFSKTGKYYDLIVNATPAGMWPECGSCPVSKELVMSAGFVFDTIYNPLATRLVLTARSFGVKADSGLRMLIAQALASQKIWNPEAEFINFSPLKLQQSLKYKMFELFPVKIVLIGFMGSGKTTTGKALAESLELEFRDLDIMIENEYGMTVSEIFKEHGEAFFRSSEREFLKQVMKEEKSLVISTGGGALMNETNLDIVRSNRGFVFFLDADPDTIIKRTSGDSGRPLLNNRNPDEIKKLHAERMPFYLRAADFVVQASKDRAQVVLEIKTALGF